MLLIAALPQVLRLCLNDEHPQSETGNETTETISKSLFSAGFHVKLTPMASCPSCELSAHVAHPTRLNNLLEFPKQRLYHALIRACKSMQWHNMSMQWHNMSMQWHNMSMQWHNMSMQWHNMSMQWHNKPMQWHNKPMQWHNKPMQWHCRARSREIFRKFVCTP